jgi:hypothetical protein
MKTLLIGILASVQIVCSTDTVNSKEDVEQFAIPTIPEIGEYRPIKIAFIKPGICHKKDKQWIQTKK